MDLIQIKKELDLLYEDYKQNSSQLNGEKTKKAANLITNLTVKDKTQASDVAFQLSRFSADVVKMYFKNISKGCKVPMNMLDELLDAFMKTDTNAGKSQFYVLKYAFAITSIMNSYKEIALTSSALPKLVTFNARFAVKSKKNKINFQNLINNTSGGVFLLDYSGINKDSLQNIWKAVRMIYPDLSKARYEKIITDWAKKYDLIKNEQENAPAANSKEIIKPETHTATETVNEKKSEEKQPKKGGNDDLLSEKKTTQTVLEKKTEENPPEAMCKKDNVIEPKKSEKNISESEKVTDDKPAESSYQEVIGRLYHTLRRDMAKEQETMISAVAEMIEPINKAFGLIQGEISKSRALGTENAVLSAKNDELERQLAKQKDKLSETEKSLTALRAENDRLKSMLEEAEAKNNELDSKLNEAYTINSREASLEAEKIRNDLKKAFSFLYDDWLDFEFSEVSEENYESLQAIIKKIFRSLKKNGIDFEGNN